jgi:hypothetical protein
LCGGLGPGHAAGQHEHRHDAHDTTEHAIHYTLLGASSITPAVDQMSPGAEYIRLVNPN